MVSSNIQQIGRVYLLRARQTKAFRKTGKSIMWLQTPYKKANKVKTGFGGKVKKVLKKIKDYMCNAAAIVVLLAVNILMAGKGDLE